MESYDYVEEPEMYPDYYESSDYLCRWCEAAVYDYNECILDATTHAPHTCKTAAERDVTMEDVLGIKPQPSFAKEKQMFNTVKVISRPKRGINADSLNIGEYARVVGDTKFVGNIVLKTRLGVVNISDPTSTWDSPFSMPFVERLNTGDKLDITVGFTAQIEQDLKNLKASNKIIEAIKQVREITNWNLKDSKDFVDAL